MMERRVIKTKDGSDTIEVEELGVCYHSRHGALQESIHVYIETGLSYYREQNPEKQIVTVFEMGLGTGLNAVLTAQLADKEELSINYHSIELSPLAIEDIMALNYSRLLKDEKLIGEIHNCPWGMPNKISKFFTVTKTKGKLEEYIAPIPLDVVYYDAFAPSAQPELWTEEIFKQLHSMMSEQGVLVTYCSKGDVRRAMSAAGFDVQKTQGPPGKREMLRAIKVTS